MSLLLLHSLSLSLSKAGWVFVVVICGCGHLGRHLSFNCLRIGLIIACALFSLLASVRRPSVHRLPAHLFIFTPTAHFQFDPLANWQFSLSLSLFSFPSHTHHTRSRFVSLYFKLLFLFSFSLLLLLFFFMLLLLLCVAAFIYVSAQRGKLCRRRRFSQVKYF